MGMGSKTVYRTGTGVNLLAWGALFQQVGGNPSPCKAKITDVQTHVRYNDGTWWSPTVGHDVGAANGNLYYEDFQGQVGTGTGSSAPSSRSTAADGGTLVHLPDPAQPDTNSHNDRCYHFYAKNYVNLGNGPQPRANIDGVLVACRACLDPAASAADQAAAKYVLAMAVDAKDAGGTWIQDVGIGRQKILKPGMRLVSMCSAATTGPLPTMYGVLSNQEYVNP